jgi:hypothetical protein
MVQRLLFATIVLALAAVPAAAQVATIDYYGFGWETGGIPPSNPGDVLTFTGVADFVDPVFGVSLGSAEITFHAHDLISTGEVPLGGGNVVIAYTGGTLDVYVDPAQNADWGVFPPNGTSPSSFVDGDLLFSGNFSSFSLFFTSAGDGAFEGNLDGVAGSILNGGCTDCAFTWGGAFTPDVAQVPDGYDLQIDGQFEVDLAVPTQETGWGHVKALYAH